MSDKSLNVAAAWCSSPTCSLELLKCLLLLLFVITTRIDGKCSEKTGLDTEIHHDGRHARGVYRRFAFEKNNRADNVTDALGYEDSVDSRHLEGAGDVCNDERHDDSPERRGEPIQL